MPTISICIPTYNRAAMLIELLDSIVAQNMDRVEVVVSDDASTDHTARVLARYGSRLPLFRYMRQPCNLGVDRNVAAVAAAATGDYIWLVGDDDRIEPGGIRRVVEALERWPDTVALTVGVIDYDRFMQGITGIRPMPETQTFLGAGAAFSRIAELLGYISATLVKRDAWQVAAADPRARAMDNLYSPVFIAGLAVGARGTWGVVREPCVGFRSGNDQLKRRVGWLERLRIDVRGYDEIAAMLFPHDSRVRRAAARRIFDTHVIARIVNAKACGETRGDTLKAAGYLIRRYAAQPRLWTLALPLLLAPGRTVRALRHAYQRVLPCSGARRAHRLTLQRAQPAA